ncbi:DNA internalization-related competence protein ComEC/Rec2 [Laceyella putida]|uniref:DNA internalization-related competence protein ComEC/Rec2 n=1 Tax=Laceyella putida TaxID=110101 RepID=A0ABW2RIA4_9BACL
MKRPLVVLSVGWMLGSILVGWCGLPPLVYFVGFVIALAGGGWIYYQWRKGIVVTLLMVGLCAAGWRIAWMEAHQSSAITPLIRGHGTQMVPVVGTIRSLPERDGDRLQFVLVVDRIRLGGKWHRLPKREPVQVTVILSTLREWQQAGQVEPYQTVKMPLTFSPPPLPRNPAAFDYRTYLAHRGIHWLGEGKSLSVMRPLAVAHYHPMNWVYGMRQRSGEVIERLYPPAIAGVMRGILLGERKAVPERVEQDYATLGIIHLLSISGLHVSVLLAGGYIGLKRLGMTREKAAIVVLVCLPVYVILTGMGAPVIRSALMAGMVLLATLWRHHRDLLSFLALSFLGQCVWNPYQLGEAGFQLTYAITAALIVGTHSLSEALPLPWSWARQMLAGTMIAQGVSLPFSFVHFHEYSLLSWLANLLFVPVVSLGVTPLGMMSLFLAQGWETGAAWLAHLVTMFVKGVEWGTDWMVWANPLHFTWQAPPVWWLACYALFSLYLFAAWCGAFRHTVVPHRICSLVCWLALLCVAAVMQEGGSATRVTFLDVSQGDCTVIETKTGHVIVIDGGGRDIRERRGWQARKTSFDAGKQVVLPFLKAQGIHQIDTLVMTHGDLDHIGGIQVIVERIPVKRVVRNPSSVQTPMEQEVMETIRRRAIPVYVPRLGRSVTIDEGVEWQFYHPGMESRRERNEDSLVFLVTIEGVRLLFPGDAGSPTETELLRRVRLPDIHLLKVAHHGSRSGTQAEWLKTLRPEHAVISVGERNRYGHPAPEVIQRLQRERIHIWRTDRQGAIQVEIEDGRLRFAPFLKIGSPFDMKK